MSNKSVFVELAAGLKDALSHARGVERSGLGRTAFPLDVSGIRQKLRIPQREFAELLSVSVETLRSWEEGRRAPLGPVRILLRVIDLEPAAVLRALDVG